MNFPTPAIVSQAAVRPLPRALLLLLCLAYVVPGFVARAPWKTLDITSFGYAMALAEGRTPWLAPEILGLSPDTEGLIPYWLGAWAIQAFGDFISPELASRLPFAALLWLALMATWYAVYYLARSPGAGPVAFAFGGEANEIDYARAMADGGLLALIACLGLAQPSHEASSYVVQLSGVCFVFYAAACIPIRFATPLCVGAIGLVMLALSGAPTYAVCLGLGVALILALTPVDAKLRARSLQAAGVFAILGVAALLLAVYLHQWQWRILPAENFRQLRPLFELVVWYVWPAWPLALWSLWIWRRQVADWRFVHRHLWLPILLAGLALVNTVITTPSDRALLLGLPAFAALAAFALPTFRRAMAALIDWFTLLFFSAAAITIWVIWLAVYTGTPAKPAANVARIAPDFVAQFSLPQFAIAALATLAWCALVFWRARRNRPEIWRSLVLPAGGTVLSWILLMSIWMPMLDYGRSYTAQVQALAKVLPAPMSAGCVAAWGLSRSQIVAMQAQGGWKLKTLTDPASQSCNWLAMPLESQRTPSNEVLGPEWQRIAAVARPTDKNAEIVIYRRQAN
ncbi:UDP phosphate-alpha-4-amino-4-deoxy-L-arabinose arabinosyl transferase [Comamonas piscis]